MTFTHVFILKLRLFFIFFFELRENHHANVHGKYSIEKLVFGNNLYFSDDELIFAVKISSFRKVNLLIFEFFLNQI